MLRARFSKEGKQAILPEISKLPIEIYHLENETENDINREILQREIKYNLNNTIQKKISCLIWSCS